jgi:hypothetical protein
MNYRGSSRHLLRNAKSALLAAIEIYNKPGFSYRDECFVILLLNAWELILKALISKNGKSIYYRKKRGEPYKTLSVDDAFTMAEKFFPKAVQSVPVRNNIDLLSTYRDNSVHFYNEQNFGVVIYALAQTSIVNFKDLLKESFRIDLGEDITWQLMPIGLEPPIDPLLYISEGAKPVTSTSSAVKQFLTALAASIKEVESAQADTGRLLTIFRVSLQSVKKIEHADLTVGVTGSGVDPSAGPLVITKIKDPNVTHPLRQKDVLERVGNLHGKKFTSHIFQAICYKFGFKEDQQYCWRATGGVLTRYSNDIVTRIQRISEDDVKDALLKYKQKSKR